MNKLLARIEKDLNHLSDAERIIGQYIIENHEFIPNMTTKDLSHKTGVSEASVVRFCKSIGIGSFKLFKIELVKHNTMTQSNLTDFSILQKKDAPYDLFHKVTYANKSAIESSLSSLDRKELEKAAEAIQHASRLVFFGVGGSATAAYDAYYKFTRLGFHCNMDHDFHFMLSLIPYLKRNDILFAISTSGKTKDVLELAKFAKSKGIIVIAITNLDKSPLHKLASIRLCTPVVEQDFRVGTLSSRMTQLNIIDALYLATFNRVGDSVVEQYQEARKEVIKLRR
ncbi:MurR/RpiR family transcriptional regulator [Bacillus massilinigeriensis]|uniref:MurR/RpiR family transcriptional regulator n=1 Tax=Bacillus mediterraneensis TaxID=1805474 RepID=UPI0008F8E2D7|nr:MurR/RpiR family transcriptional regulator [Bacillus mediterraneensis]